MSKNSVVPIHPSQLFRIPGKIRAEFEVVERWVQSEAAQNGLSVSQVVEAILLFTTKEVKARRVQFPEFSRCRRNPVILKWVEIPESERSGPPPTFPKPTPRHERPKSPPTRTVSYRIAPNVADWVRRMANDYFAIGEMLLILLSHGMKSVQEGRANFKFNSSVEIETAPDQTFITNSNE